MAPPKGTGAGKTPIPPKKPTKTAEQMEEWRKRAEHARSFVAPENLGGQKTQTLYKPEYARIARVMCKRGATNTELGDAFGVTRKTIQIWRNNNEDFDEALKVGKGEFDDRVERAFAERAVGYEIDSVKIFFPAGADAPVYAHYREHIPADVAAAKAWLCSRKRDQWKDRWEITGADGAPLMPIVALLSEINGRTASLVGTGASSEGQSAPSIFGQDVEAEQPLLDHRQEREAGQV